MSESMRNTSRLFRMAGELFFALSALAMGASVQLNWFTNNRWYPHDGSLLDFAVNGAWQEHQMATRLLVSPGLMVVAFYLVNLLTRVLLFRVLKLRSRRETYIRYDKLTYGVFLLSSLGLVGIYLDIGLLLAGFFLLQLLLIHKSEDTKGTSTDSAILLENRWLVILFFCSGFAALIYQIVWQRALFQAFGVNIESVTIIVSIFMFGLGVGALAGGAVSRRYPLYLPHLFVGCEAIIGLFGLVSLRLIDAVTQATIHSSLLTVSGAVYGLLFIPTLFMGATLPILVSYLYKTYHNVGRSLSVLYFANTLGSAIACFSCAYLLFLFLGLKASCYSAALINLGVAYVGYRFVRRDAERASGIPDMKAPAATEDAVSKVDRADLRYLLILLISATVGFVSLSQEILWVRLISFTTGGRATVFPLVLGFFLIGIALGSLKANRICEQQKDKVLNIVAGFIIASSLCYFVVIPIVGRVVGVVGYAGLPLMFVGIGGIAFLTGAVLPMLAHYAITSYAHVGFSVSWIYCMNIIGSTAGSLFTGFFLLNWLPIEENILVLSLFYCFFGVVLWFFSRSESGVSNRALGVGGAAILLFLIYEPLYFDLLERLFHKGEYSENGSFKYEDQSRYGIINVVEQDGGDDLIAGGGGYDGRFNTDLVNNHNMIDRAYMMAALHPEPRHVLEIGLSSASWAKVIAGHEAVESLDIVEINPGYAAIVQNYPEQRSVLSDPKVKVHFDDGRRWLKRHPGRKYDFILMNTTYHWRDQINNIISRDFLELCKMHLNEGGVIYYNTTNSWDIPYTAAHVFDYVTRYSNFIAASDRPFPAQADARKRNLLRFEYHDEPIAENSDPELSLVIDGLAASDLSNRRSEYLSRASLLYLITDDNLASEFKTRKRMFTPSRNWLQLLGI